MKVYLDNAASTQIDPNVWKVIQNAVKDYANPSSLHAMGKDARARIENARKIIASKINAQPYEIHFTSGGTEANNLAIRGIVARSKKKEIITSTIEHASVIETCKELANKGYKSHFLPVDKKGIVDLTQLAKKISSKTALVSIMHANNEVGTIQPIEKIARICAKHNVPFHTDAVQSFTKVPLNVKKTDIHAVTLSGHKIHAPKGIGAMYVRKGTHIEHVTYGGHQEGNLRPGTENSLGIVGFGAAASINQPVKKIQALRDYLIKEVLNNIPKTTLNGHKTKRLCNNVNISFEGIESESLLLHLSLQNIYVSIGAACDSKDIEPSHVLTAMGISRKQAYGTIRFTLSKYNNKKQIDYAIRKLKRIVTTLRKVQ